jgi:uncharacterized membrane protein YedE/YeeE
MVCPLKRSSWSPYSAGALIGLLSVGSFFFLHKTLGTSTTFVKFSAALWQIFHKKSVLKTSYFSDYLHNKSWIDWQMMLVLGIFIGAFLSKKMNKRKLEKQTALSIWQKAIAFFGGVILMFGARLAGGCTSGHAISGGFQLALSGYLFMIGVFAVGIPVAFLLYKKFNVEKL